MAVFNVFTYADLLELLKVTCAEDCFFMSFDNVEREPHRNIQKRANKSKHTYVRKAGECFASDFYGPSWSNQKPVKNYVARNWKVTSVYMKFRHFERS